MRVRITAATIVIALAGVAAAEPPGLTPAMEPAAPAPERLEPSYRVQTAMVDAAALGVLLVGASTHSEDAGKLAAATYLLGGPIVHLLHDRPGRAAGSLAMRLGLPLLGAVIGAQHSGCHQDECDGGETIVLGILGGFVAATVVDTVFLAKGDEPAARPAWSPAVSASRSGVSLGVAGAF